MAIIKAFKGFRPQKELVSKIASRPYDVLSSEEAAEQARGNPFSFYHIIKSEIDLPADADHYSMDVYNKAKSNLQEFISKKYYNEDKEPCLYIYAQTMWGRTQYGLVACASVSDYLNNVIRKHELTRTEKEEDRKNHIRITNFNCEPVFFAYPDHEEIDRLVNHFIKGNPEYDFKTSDDIHHQLWIINDSHTIKRIESIFNKEIPYTYIADGHHRTAAAAHVGEERKMNNPQHKGNEEYNFFLAVHFPASQLSIFDYNRVVKDLNGNTPESLIKKIEEKFMVIPRGTHEYKPAKAHEFSMYLEGKWYALEALNGTYDDNDPIGCLDVTILSDHILDKILDIKDLRNSKRIDFVGGIRGLGELKRRVDSGEMAVAFALYPVTMEQLIRIADTGNIMPPKTTWFEPKLRSGLVIHSLE
ncbi:MAG TPA: DUF1015 family protein [Bacteroidales bacterium]|nr:DUF1015 family protein [Bacteroidales bacterium]